MSISPRPSAGVFSLHGDLAHTLVAMAKRDYYDVLGVSRSATADEIRKAHRKLALKFHPDRNKEADAAKKFAEIQEAYDVLSDEAKRKNYDQFGHDAPNFAGAGRAPRGGTGGGGGVHTGWAGAEGTEFDAEDLSSMFETFFGGRSGFGDSMRGGPGSGSGARGRAKPQRRADLEHTVEIPFMLAATGGTHHIRVSRDGQVKTIEVTIPAGINDGSQLRIRGAGQPATRGHEATDLILTVKVQQHEVFWRGEGANAGKGLDVHLNLPLALGEAALGATVSVPTLSGNVELTIPAGTASGKKLRLKGKGIKTSSGEVGDLYAIIQIIPPAAASLSEAQRQILEELAKSQPTPRSGPGWGSPKA